MITTQALKLALGLTAPSIAPRKALSEAIKCVKIDLDPEDKIARITTSNLEQTSRADISYNGSLSASFLIDGEAAKALMRLQCDEIVLSMQKESLRVTGGRVNIVIPTRDSSAFPDMTEQVPTGADVWTDSISTSFIEHSILSVAHSAGRDASRPALMAIKFVNEAGLRVKTYATDGHRMSIASVEGSPLSSMLLPTSAIKAIQRSIKDAMNCKVAIGSADNKTLLGNTVPVFALCGELEVEVGDDDVETIEWLHSFRLQNETGFPDLEAVWKKMGEGDRVAVEVDIAPVRSALSLAGIFDKEHNKMRLSFTGSEMVINAASDKGDATITLDILNGAPDLPEGFELGVSGKYLMEALGSSLEDSVKLLIDKQQGDQRPLLITSATKKDMIMPMRL